MGDGGPNCVKTRPNHVPTLRTPYLGNRTAIEQLCEKTDKKMPKKMPFFGNGKGWLIAQQKTQLLMRPPKKCLSFVDLSRGHTGHGFFSHESLCFGSTTHLSCTVDMQKFRRKIAKFSLQNFVWPKGSNERLGVMAPHLVQKQPSLNTYKSSPCPSMMHFYRQGVIFR